MSHSTRLVAAIAVAVLTAGCGGSGDSGSEPASRPTTELTRTSPTSPSSPTPAHFTPTTRKCGIKARQLRDHVIRGPLGSRLPAATVGRSTTVAVFLHETSSTGFCGWVPFAAWASRHYDFEPVLFDMCGYGESDCPGDRIVSPIAQVRDVASWARQRGARRLVVVGASMGGNIAPAAALAVHADAVVDLSGEVQSLTIDVREVAPRLTMPTLFAIAHGDPYTGYRAFRSAFEQVPATHTRFITAPAGHGWEADGLHAAAPAETTGSCGGTMGGWLVRLIPHRAEAGSPRIRDTSHGLPSLGPMRDGTMMAVSERYSCADDEERERGLAAAAASIGSGEIVVFPTDTVYGIGADAFDPAAVRRLLRAKGRGRDMPPPVLVSAIATLDALATEVTAQARDLVGTFWPGPLTVVCRQQASLQWDLGDTRGTVAVRMPNHHLARSLLEQTGPLAVSSANLTGHAPARTAAEAETMLGNAVQVYLDDGPSGAAEPSTILDVTGEVPVVLRHGAVSLEQLHEVAPDVRDLERG